MACCASNVLGMVLALSIAVGESDAVASASTRKGAILSREGESPGDLTDHRHHYGDVRANIEANPPPFAFLLGEQKCGTTWFYYLLRQHPSVCNACHLKTDAWSFMDKEMHFFDESGANATADNRIEHFFDYTGHFRQCPREQLRIDGTPDYLSHRYAPDLLVSTYSSLGLDPSSLRFLVILRDPVERFVSAYEHLQRHGIIAKNLTLRQVARSEIRAYRDWEASRHQVEPLSSASSGGGEEEIEAVPSSSSFLRESKIEARAGDIITRGLYHQSLMSWFRLFSPSQFLILTLDQLNGDTTNVTKAAQAHVGLQPIIDLEDRNAKSQYHSAYARDFDREILRELAEVYAPSLEQLQLIRDQHPASFYATTEHPFEIQAKGDIH